MNSSKREVRFQELPPELLEIVLQFCDGRTMSTLGVAGTFTIDSAMHVAQLRFMELYEHVTHLPVMQRFIVMVLASPSLHYSTLFGVLDYLEFGTKVSQQQQTSHHTLQQQQQQQDCERMQWPIWCDNVTYHSPDGLERGESVRTILCTPCWHPQLLECSSCMGIVLSFGCQPYPAPAGTAYILDEMELGQSGEYCNIVANIDNEFVVFPVIQSTLSTCRRQVPTQEVLQREIRLACSYLDDLDENEEDDESAIQIVCDQILELNHSLLEEGFPLLYKSQDFIRETEVSLEKQWCTMDAVYDLLRTCMGSDPIIRIK